jgi:hypothetical protein
MGKNSFYAPGSVKARAHTRSPLLRSELARSILPPMKTTLAVLFFCVSLFGQSQPAADAPDPAFPLTLSVTMAQRGTQNGFTITHITGYLSDDPDKTQMHMECDAAIFARGPHEGVPNTYPARRAKPHQIKIESREIGSDKIHEHTCKY